MTAHDELCAAAGNEVQLLQHGEKIIYRPKGERPRSMDAIIVRHNVQPIAEVPRSSTNHMTVKVLSHPTQGMVGSDIDSGGDEVDVALKKGGVPETRSVTRFVGVIGGFSVFEVQ